jgi:hypothetical protein
MRRISENRLREMEKKAPRPFEQLVITLTIVDPDPHGGPPIVAGVVKRSRTMPRGQPSIVEWFDPLVPQDSLPVEPVPEAVAAWERLHAKARPSTEVRGD